MTEPLADTWSTRDLPVLTASVLGVDENPRSGIRLQGLCEKTGFDERTAYSAVKALESAGLVRVNERFADNGDLPYAFRLVSVSGEGRRRAGSWPTEETALVRIIEALEAIAVNTDDEDTRSNARRTSDWLRRSIDSVGLAVATAAITGHLPGM